MKFREIANRMTGFSTPIFGVQWTPAQLDRDVAKEVIVFLEDRRALFEPYEVEMPEWVVQSVLEIRTFLTDVLRRAGIADELADSLKAMRTACRKFMQTVGDDRGPGLIVSSHQDMFGVGGWAFNQALGELRGVVGVHLAQISVRHGVDVAEPLSSILPLAAETDADKEAAL
jgi:hypothetical protein